MTLEVNVVPCRSDNYAYLIRETTTGQTAVVDVPDAAPVLSALDERGQGLDRIFLTHHHHDHVDGVDAVRSRTGAKVVGASGDAYRLPVLDVAVSEGDSVRLGEAVAEVIDVSGHTVGHIAYVFGTENWAFTGDSLMMMGCGRVFEGTFEMMYQSLARFRNMPDDMLICSGHEYAESNARFALSVEPDNPDLLERVAWIRRTLAAGSPTVPSPLGIERLTNPFLRCEVPSVRSALGMESASGAEVFAELRKRKDSF